MAVRLFGTDGVRGLANRDLTAELALELALAAARVLGAEGQLSRRETGRPLAVVGSDSRASGDFLEAAIVAGLASAGVDVRRVGVLPTPGVAYMTAALGADLGVMLSASHNPMPDNGIKLFARGGHKLADEIEDEIEASMGLAWQRPTGEHGGPGVGRGVGRRGVCRPPGRYGAPLTGGAQGCRGLRQRGRQRGRPDGAAGGWRRGDRDPQRPRRLQHQPQLRVHAHGFPDR